MPKTNWQDPGSTEVRSTHIAGLQAAVGKIEDALNMTTLSVTNQALSEVYISEQDRYRIYQAPPDKKNWVASPAPVIKVNGVAISSGFEIDYGGGAVIFSPPLTATDVVTADFTYVGPQDIHVGAGGSAHSLATTADAGFMSAADKTKLDGIQAGAEVNQNAFANIKVGTTTISADAKQDTLELAAGSNIALTPDAANDKVTIAVTGQVTPVAHKSTHATGGTDVLTPSDIGAETPAGAQSKVDAHAGSKQTHGVSGTYYLAKTSRSDQLPAWADIPDKPTSFTPSAHKSTHATSGSDPLTPGDIGAIQNAGATPSIMADIDANKPAAGVVGRIYIATDTKKIYRDNGTAWVQLAESELAGVITLHYGRASTASVYAISTTKFLYNTAYSQNGNLYFEVIGRTSNSLNTAYFELVDITTSTVIVTISTTSTSEQLIRSAAISIPDGHTIWVRIRASDSSYYTDLYVARLIIL